jgi:3-oxoacyl-[acyl-carrier protein] reductase
VAWITGAGSGIGRATALRFAQEGAQLVLSDVEAGPLDDVVSSVRAAGGKAIGVPGSVTRREEVELMVRKGREAFGRLDILINNAGITRDNLLVQLRDEDWDDVIKVNLTATFRLARAATKLMMRKRFGRIIAITSIVGVTGNPGQANYTASKAGIIGLIKTLGAEYAKRNVTANCIAPGSSRRR